MHLTQQPRQPAKAGCVGASVPSPKTKKALHPPQKHPTRPPSSPASAVEQTTASIFPPPQHSRRPRPQSERHPLHQLKTIAAEGSPELVSGSINFKPKAQSVPVTALALPQQTKTSQVIFSGGFAFFLWLKCRSYSHRYASSGEHAYSPNWNHRPTTSNQERKAF